MRRTFQTRLAEFEEDPLEKQEWKIAVKKPHREKKQIWRKTTRDGGKWGVVRFDGTVLFVRVIDGQIFAHGLEALCKWCDGKLEIRDERVFCKGRCKRFQGDFASDLNAFLRWEGAKSFTLRREVAESEKLHLESRDLEPISYAPDWSAFDQYEDDEEF